MGVSGVCLLLAAPAWAQTCPTTLNALSFWYQASPGFAGEASVRMTATFTNGTTSNMSFTGSTFQMWSEPSADTIPVTIVSEPSGIVAPGADATYDLILDTSGLAPSETSFSFRPRDTMFGTMAPATIPLSSVSFACTAAVPVPVATPWGLAALAIGLGFVSLLHLRRSRTTRRGVSA
jgi:hypothetical protein